MSEGLANIAGAHTPQVTIGGKTYRMRVKVLQEYAEREAYIYSLKGCPFEAIERFPELPKPEPIMRGKTESEADYSLRRQQWNKQKEAYESRLRLRYQLMDRAMEKATEPRVVTHSEEARFDSSNHGTAYSFWRSVRDNHPEVDSVQAALDILEHATESESLALIKALREVTEEDQIKNCDGPEHNGPPNQSAEQLSESDFLGEGSTTTLQINTNGPLTTSAQ